RSSLSLVSSLLMTYRISRGRPEGERRRSICIAWSARTERVLHADSVQVTRATALDQLEVLTRNPAVFQRELERARLGRVGRGNVLLGIRDQQAAERRMVHSHLRLETKLHDGTRFGIHDGVLLAIGAA